MLAFYLGLVLLLLMLNAFYALGEFAVVKIRPTRVEELAGGGDGRAQALQHIKARLDEYLSVCQVGVTLSSIGLGFVGEPAVARLLQPLLERAGMAGSGATVAVSVIVTYLLMSYLSIVLAELVPKTIALRATEPMALLVARPMRISYTLFYVPLVILNRSADAVLRLLGFPRREHSESLSEEELRMVLAASQGGGGISFRQLLHIENVLDAAGLKVRDAMRTRGEARSLRLEAPWAENEKVIVDSRFSRFPMLEAGVGLPTRMLHVKDLLHARRDGGTPDLAALARPILSVREDAPLQELLTEFQRRRTHLAVVTDGKGAWTGLVTLEDVLEEFMGTVEDEFEKEPAISLADGLSARRIVLGVEAASMQQALRVAIGSVPEAELPLPAARILAAVQEREARFSTYLGRGLAIPHARLEGLERPALIFARSTQGIPLPGREDRARLMFILLTPAQAAHVQVRLLGRIAGLLDSEYVEKQLYEAKDAEGVLEAIRSGELAAPA